MSQTLDKFLALLDAEETLAKFEVPFFAPLAPPESPDEGEPE